MRSIALLAAIGAGAITPAIPGAFWLIRVLVMLMLFLAFLGIRFRWADAHWSHVAIPLAGVVSGYAAYFALRGFSGPLALAALLICVTPSATASPVIARMLGAEGAYTTFAVLSGNVFSAWVIPAVLSTVARGSSVGVAGMLGPVLLTVLLPLGIVLGLRGIAPKVARRLAGFKLLPFLLWLVVLWLASSTAMAEVRAHASGGWLVGQMFLVSGVLCVVNFAVGRWLGGRRFALEAGQSMGQKNTMLTAWIALRFLDPVVCLGPAFYVLWHNLYNAWQIARAGVDASGSGGQVRGS